MRYSAKRFFLITLAAIFFSAHLYTNASGQKAPTHPEIPRISGKAARSLYQQGKLVLANAHERESYEREHLIGSISLPEGEVEHMNIKLPRNLLVAFYCQ